MHSSAKLTGQWELKSSTSGMTGQVINYPIDAGNILVLVGSTYKETRNNKVLREGKYTTARKMSILSNKVEDMIMFDNPDIGFVVSMDGDILSIYPDVYDGGSFSYKKK